MMHLLDGKRKEIKVEMDTAMGEKKGYIMTNDCSSALMIKFKNKNNVMR